MEHELEKSIVLNKGTQLITYYLRMPHATATTKPHKVMMPELP